MAASFLRPARLFVLTSFLSPGKKATMCNANHWAFAYRQMTSERGTHAVFPDVPDRAWLPRVPLRYLPYLPNAPAGVLSPTLARPHGSITFISRLACFFHIFLVLGRSTLRELWGKGRQSHAYDRPNFDKLQHPLLICLSHFLPYRKEEGE